MLKKSPTIVEAALAVSSQWWEVHGGKDDGNGTITFDPPIPLESLREPVPAEQILGGLLERIGPRVEGLREWAGARKRKRI